MPNLIHLLKQQKINHEKHIQNNQAQQQEIEELKKAVGEIRKALKE